jgi:hypothetical protein
VAVRTITLPSGATATGEPGYETLDVNSAPPPNPINRTVSEPNPAVTAAESFLTNFKPPETTEQIAERKRRDSQALIDSINKVRDDEIAAAQERGKERLSERGAISVMSGIAGSPRAFAARDKVSTANEKEQNAIREQYALQVQKI